MGLNTASKSTMSFVGRLRAILSEGVSSAWNAFDRRDILVFGGLAILYHGLHLISPAIASSVCGSVVLLIGLMGYFHGGAK